MFPGGRKRQRRGFAGDKRVNRKRRQLTWGGPGKIKNSIGGGNETNTKKSGVGKIGIEDSAWGESSCRIKAKNQEASHAVTTICEGRGGGHHTPKRV